MYWCPDLTHLQATAYEWLVIRDMSVDRNGRCSLPMRTQTGQNQRWAGTGLPVDTYRKSLCSSRHGFVFCELNAWGTETFPELLWFGWIRQIYPGYGSFSSNEGGALPPTILMDLGKESLLEAGEGWEVRGACLHHHKRAGPPRHGLLRKCWKQEAFGGNLLYSRLSIGCSDWAININ